VIVLVIFTSKSGRVKQLNFVIPYSTVIGLFFLSVLVNCQFVIVLALLKIFKKMSIKMPLNGQNNIFRVLNVLVLSKI